jgi:PKD repeat protein
VSGTAPLQVNLTVTASGAAPTSFTLAFGDGQAKSGTTLPATFAHGYAAGSYTAKATATYANGKTAESTVSLAAVAAPAAAHGPLYNKTLSATLPFSWTGGVATDIALCGSPVPGGDAVSCPDQQLLTAYQKGLNKTFLLGTTITVPAGASTLAVDGGTDAKQTCQEVPEFGTLCTPDMDLWVFDPTGASTPFTTAADYEAGVIQAPAPGTWTIICHYFFGPPQQDMSLHVLIA